jgi:myosin heavy subunit
MQRDIDILSRQIQQLTEQEAASRKVMQGEIIRLNEALKASENQLLNLVSREKDLMSNAVSKDEVISELNQVLRKQKDALVGLENDRRLRDVNEKTVSEALERKGLEYSALVRAHEEQSEQHRMLKNQFEELIRSNQHLNQIVTESQRLLTESETKLKDFDSLEKEHRALKEDISTLLRQKNLLEEKVSRLIDDIRVSDKAHSEKQREIEELLVKSVKVEKNLGSLKEENELLKQKLAKKREKRTNLKRAYENEMSTNLNLRGEIQQLKSKQFFLFFKYNSNFFFDLILSE